MPLPIAALGAAGLLARFGSRFLGRIPGLGRAAGAAPSVGRSVAGGAAFGGGLQVAGRFVTGRGGAAAAGGLGVGAFAATRGTGGNGMFDPTAGGANVAYTWNTGTAIFYRLFDGRIAVQKSNGVWKVYRPQKHIVVPRNPRVGTFNRARKRLDRLEKHLPRRTVTKKVPFPVAGGTRITKVD